MGVLEQLSLDGVFKDVQRMDKRQVKRLESHLICILNHSLGYG